MERFKAIFITIMSAAFAYLGVLAVPVFALVALNFTDYITGNNPFLVHVCACMFMAFYLGWVFLQPSEKEAFRNGRVQEIQKLNEELAASQENFRLL